MLRSMTALPVATAAAATAAAFPQEHCRHAATVAATAATAAAAAFPQERREVA